MASTHRLFVDQPIATGDELTLSADASHYVARVLRLRADSPLQLFNGDGNQYTATLIDADKKAARVSVVHQETSPSYASSLNLGLALLKGDKLDFALQKATELDVSTIWLVDTKRCELRLSAKRLENRMAHWRKILISACEQSGRTRVPQLHPPQSLNQTLSETQSMQRYCLHPAAEPGTLEMGDTSVCLFTGPEGGFDQEEQTLLSAQCTSVQLGELVLRAETAPIVGLALLGAARRAHRGAG